MSFIIISVYAFKSNLDENAEVYNFIKLFIMKKYLIPIAVGFAGMFLAHIIILLGFGYGIRVPLYFLAYPIVYSLIAFLLALKNQKWWFSNVACICIIPFIYWYLLLWSDGKMYWTDAINVTDSSAMLLILPFTFLIATFVSLSVAKFKKSAQQIN